MIASPTDQIMVYVSRLRDPRTPRSERLSYLRWIISAAQDAHDVETRELDQLSRNADLNFGAVDPSVLPGVTVE